MFDFFFGKNMRNLGEEVSEILFLRKSGFVTVKTTIFDYTLPHFFFRLKLLSRLIFFVVK